MDGRDGPAVALALRVLSELGRLVGADRLIPVASAHVDGCLYHGDSGVAFAERLQAGGGARHGADHARRRRRSTCSIPAGSGSSPSPRHGAA